MNCRQGTLSAVRHFALNDLKRLSTKKRLAKGHEA
jgi:hypothetical protein